jgi:hypothetical protein
VQETVQAAVGFTEKESDLDPVFELLDDDRLPDCLEEAFQTFLGRAAGEAGGQLEFTGVEVARTDPSGVGDEGARLQMEGGIEVQGFELGFMFDLEMVRVGRAAAMLMYGAIGEAGTEVDEQHRADALEQLVDAVAGEG